MSDRYAVFGNPVAHSRSPAIHAAFARQTGQDIVYEALAAPLDGFAAALHAFAAAGGRGANVTVPFKREAWRLADRRSARAQAAGAVNTLRFDAQGLFGDNTDGAGLIADICGNLGYSIAGRRVLLLGAGGAARGVLLPLLAAAPRRLVLANRSEDRAQALREEFAAAAAALAVELPEDGFEALGLPALAGGRFELVIDATSAGLAGAPPQLPEAVFDPAGLAYDLVYGPAARAFLDLARRQGVAKRADGLGMLVEQAAESFLLWRGVRPQTAPVLAWLRASG